MNDKIYLPNKNNKAYTPLGVANLMRQAEKENGGKLEIVLNNKWISKKQIYKAISFYGNCEYSNYLNP